MALIASARARSVPTRRTSPTEAEVCRSLSFDRVSRKAGESASYAAVSEVNAVSPPPDLGISRTQKKVVEGTFGVKV